MISFISSTWRAERGQTNFRAIGALSDTSSV
jgi:hypothetical protein